MPLSPEKKEKLSQRMSDLGIREEDLCEHFVQGGGPGGQKINKTASCVCLSHEQSGIDIKCQRTRSLSLNRYYARWELCERIAEKINGIKSERQSAREKVRRQKRRRSRRQKAKMLDDKHKHAEKKSMRRKPNED